jgi:hypothetical protein
MRELQPPVEMAAGLGRVGRRSERKGAAMRLPRMTVKRWLVVTAVVAVDCAGMFCGPDELALSCVVTTAWAIVLVPLAIIARRLGPDVFGR